MQWLEIVSQWGVRNKKAVYGFISYSPWVYLINGWNPDICCDVWLTKGISRGYWICSKPRFSTPCEMKIGNSLSKLNCWSRGGFSMNWRLVKESIGLRLIIYQSLKDSVLSCTKQPYIWPDSRRKALYFIPGPQRSQKIRRISFLHSELWNTGPKYLSWSSRRNRYCLLWFLFFYLLLAVRHYFIHKSCLITKQ